MTGTESGGVGEPNGSGVFELLLASRWLLLVAFLVFGGTAYLLAGLMRPAYRAIALAMPAQSSNSGLPASLSSLVGSSALSSLGLAQDAAKSEILETLRSRTIIQHFIEERKLLPMLCSSRAIDCDSPVDAEGLIAERQMNDAIKLFREDLLSVSEDSSTGVIYVSVVWYDRKLASDWCSGIISLTNRRMQEDARDLAAKRVVFLRQEYERTSIVSIQSVISTLLQSELSREMDAITKPEYALRIVDPATMPDDRFPVRPRKAVIAVAGGFVGALLTLTVVVIRRRRGK